jgi:hypothetical protein
MIQTLTELYRVSINDCLVQPAMDTCQILNVPLCSANNECHIFRLGCWLLTRDKFQLCFTLAIYYLISTTTGEQLLSPSYRHTLYRNWYENKSKQINIENTLSPYAPIQYCLFVCLHFLFYASDKYAT